MPLYTVYHSYSLSAKQKACFAERITHLHARMFTTPSVFVNVSFQPEDAMRGNYFVAGKAKSASTNRITGMVRMSATRTKEQFDRLAEQIEHAWHDVLNGGDGGGNGEREHHVTEGEEGEQNEREKDKKKGGHPESEKAAQDLLFITFYQMVGAREKGIAIPAAGEEAQWVQEHREEFQKRAEMGDEDFTGMLEEIEEREDLAAWRS